MSVTEKDVTVLEGDLDVDSIIKRIVSDKEVEDDDPFYVADLGEVVSRYQHWQEYLPDVTPYYAVKCNPDKILVKTLAELGASFDCSTLGEIQLVLALGVEPERVVFAHTVKNRSHLVYAAHASVNLLTLDNLAEVDKIAALHPRASVLVRVRSDAARCQIELGSKFGCEEEQVPALLAAIHQQRLHLQGVCFHVGSLCQEEGAYRRGIALSSRVFQLARQMGLQPDTLDVGGGFDGLFDYSLLQVSEEIMSAVREYFPEGVRLMAEPGRYFSQAAFTLVTSVVGVQSASPVTRYYLSDGVYTSFICSFTDDTVYKPYPLDKREGEEQVECSLWGPTCDSLDRVMARCLLRRMQVGEWLVFPEMGSYSRSNASFFSCVPVPPVHHFISTHYWRLLKGAEGLNGHA